ncbi:DUF998 domain-containing protein [Actinocrispum sp. NPDC049592]|uniref:DUF998 domain-containing protein n=1 Tax=Actinocrispum sp. NPDC049592 TaxID=3154835 RepID=UPI00342CFF18
MTAVACDPTTSVTKSLLGYGVLAGPFYVVVSLIEAVTRQGFDLTKHPWSLLANGSLGWIHTLNLILSGMMVVAATQGMRRMGIKHGHLLLAGYGAGLIGAGIFRADPAAGFPQGESTEVTWHGTLHFVVAGIGFACLVAACFALARRSGMVWFSRVTGVVFLAAFAGIASGGGSVAMNLAFTAAVVLASVWLSVVSVRLYREA